MRDKANIIVFFLALALFIVFVLILPPDPDAPEYENRSMAGMPALTVKNLQDGSFFDDLEAHLSDSTAYRTSLLQFAADLEQNYGVRNSGGAILVDLDGEDLGFGLVPEVDDDDLYIDIKDPVDTPSPVQSVAPATTPPALRPEPDGQTPETQAPSTPDTAPADGTGQPVSDDTPQPADPVPAETTEPSPAPSTPQQSQRVDPTKPFSIDMNYNEDAILYERYRQNTQAARRYAEIINSYREHLPESIRIFSMLAPIRVEFMEQYASSNDSQRDTIDLINGILDERILKTATYEKLAQHKDEYIHFRTDHHWTALGAYYAYLTFAESAGFEPVGIENYIEHSVSGFLGSFGKGTQNKTIKDNPDTIYYYALDNGTTFSRKMFVFPEDLSTVSYRVFLGGDYAKLDFNSSNKNGKTLVIIKDSYANALIPWLSPHYERIIVIDPRQYDGSVTSLLSDIESADLLFMDYVAATAMADFIETINRVR